MTEPLPIIAAREAVTRNLVSLREALDELAEAELAKDEGRVWRWTDRALGSLYSCEEAAKKLLGKIPYYDRRALDEGGRTLAGLMWLRGLLVHHQADVRRLLWKPGGPVHVWDGEKWQPCQTRFWDGEKWQPAATVRIAALAWPTRDTLPKGDRNKTHDRDAFYDERVASRDLLPPLEEAHAYLTALSSEL